MKTKKGSTRTTVVAKKRSSSKTKVSTTTTSTTTTTSLPYCPADWHDTYYHDEGYQEYLDKFGLREFLILAAVIFAVVLFIARIIRLI